MVSGNELQSLQRLCLSRVLHGFWGAHTSPQLPSPALFCPCTEGLIEPPNEPFTLGFCCCRAFSFIVLSSRPQPLLSPLNDFFSFPSSLSLSVELPGYQRPPAVLIYWLSRPFSWGVFEGYIALGRVCDTSEVVPQVTLRSVSPSGGSE